MVALMATCIYLADVSPGPKPLDSSHCRTRQTNNAIFAVFAEVFELKSSSSSITIGCKTCITNIIQLICIFFARPAQALEHK